MTSEEIRNTYAELSAAEAFEAFDAASVDNATVGMVLGEEVAREHASWTYLNVK